MDSLRGQIQACWNVGALAGSDDAENLRARVEFCLIRNGEIDGRPTVKATGGNARANRTFAGSARRAGDRCMGTIVVNRKDACGILTACERC